MEGYFDELAHTREMFNSRYDDLKSGRVQPIDGAAFFESLMANHSSARATKLYDRREEEISLDEVERIVI